MRSHAGYFDDMFSKARVDCRQVTFLLTTNAADPLIFNYWREHGPAILQSSLKPLALTQRLRSLDRQIRSALAGPLGVRGGPPNPHCFVVAGCTCKGMICCLRPLTLP